MNYCCSQSLRVPEHIIQQGPGLHVYRCLGCGTERRIHIARAEPASLPVLVDREARKGGAA